MIHEHRPCYYCCTGRLGACACEPSEWTGPFEIKDNQHADISTRYEIHGWIIRGDQQHKEVYCKTGSVEIADFLAGALGRRYYEYRTPHAPKKLDTAERIWYHGTSMENARLILESGVFNVGTWFAKSLQDALAFGGEFIFEVKLDQSKMSSDVSWQVHTNIPIPVSEVVNRYRLMKADMGKEINSQ